MVAGRPSTIFSSAVLSAAAFERSISPSSVISTRSPWVDTDQRKSSTLVSSECGDARSATPPFVFLTPRARQVFRNSSTEHVLWSLCWVIGGGERNPPYRSPNEHH